MGQQPAPLSAAGQVVTVMAVIEAFTWAGLLLGMYLKYGSGTTDMGVWLFGRLHGLAFLGYVVVAIVVGSLLRWPLWALLLALFAAVPPLFTLPLEVLLRKRGLLTRSGN